MTSRAGLDQLTLTVPRSRAEQLADALTTHIRDARLGPGDRLGTLDDVQARAGYGRPAVNEAVRLLRERGIVEIRAGRGGGLFIAEETPAVRMRRTLLTVSTGSTTALREAIELRETLEEPLAVSVANACTDDDIERLRVAAHDLAACGADYPLFMERNWRLHELIAEICPNSMMTAVYTSCLGYLRSGAVEYADPDERIAYIDQRAAIHAALVEAIAHRDRRRIREIVIEHNAQQGQA